MSNLVDHAQRELELAGLFDKDADYGGATGAAVIELMEVFAKQGHSGGSAMLVRELFSKLSAFENLTPITDNPEDWIDRTQESGEPMWQSKRNPKIFSKDGGKTHYSI